MVELRAITEENFIDAFNLKLAPGQENFVSHPIRSLAQAYVYRDQCQPFGIYADGLPVGFLMIGYDTDESWSDPPEIAKGNYNLWRFMIDRRYQNRGYGRQALQQALEFIRTFPCGEAEYCWLSFAPENDVARRLYRSFGFRETGEKDGDELIAVLRLKEEDSHAI